MTSDLWNFDIEYLIMNVDYPGVTRDYCIIETLHKVITYWNVIRIFMINFFFSFRAFIKYWLSNYPYSTLSTPGYFQFRQPLILLFKRDRPKTGLH